MSPAARAARRRAARQAGKAELQTQASALDRGRSLLLYHGTAHAHLRSILRSGLRPPDGRRGPFLTDDRDRAMRYAVRAAVLNSDELGRRDDRIVVLTVRAPAAALVRDDTERDGTQWWAPSGIPRSGIVRWEAFDAAEAITDRDGILNAARVAQRMEQLRARLTGGS
jgi:hypothetical protein